MFDQADGTGRLEVIQVLIAIQGAILVAATLEAAVWSIAFGAGAVPAALLTAAGASGVFVVRAVLDRSRWIRRMLLAFEAAVIVGLLLETILSLVATWALPGLLPLLTRGVLPVAVILGLRRFPARVDPSAFPAGGVA